MTNRVFLDANVLFSAAYKVDARLAKLWTLRGLTLVSSGCALAEATSNLAAPDQKARLERLAKNIELVGEPVDVAILPIDIDLPEKDRPILAAAIRARATYLLTGDLRHFGSLFGKKAGGVTILLPGDYLARA